MERHNKTHTDTPNKTANETHEKHHMIRESSRLRYDSLWSLPRPRQHTLYTRYECEFCANRIKIDSHFMWFEFFSTIVWLCCVVQTNKQKYWTINWMKNYIDFFPFINGTRSFFSFLLLFYYLCNAIFFCDIHNREKWHLARLLCVIEPFFVNVSRTTRFIRNSMVQQ